ncbi:hypothetical protein [Corynebacterium stationis]|uniref:hypothetical protein n=1 Tax=Corynebacterium stationis TaxID=1705 RepID=UPI00263AF345|nr:hypothetical protein [Corynebacterium stationis]
MASVFQSAVAEALNGQPWYQRRKDTLTAVAGTVLQVLNLLVLYSGEWPAWLNAVIAGIIGICQILVHSRTKGAITPSMAKRLEDFGMQAFLDRPSQSGVTVDHPIGDVADTPGDVELPVYRGVSTAD